MKGVLAIIQRRQLLIQHSGFMHIYAYSSAVYRMCILSLRYEFTQHIIKLPGIQFWYEIL